VFYLKELKVYPQMTIVGSFENDYGRSRTLIARCPDAEYAKLRAAGTENAKHL